MEERRLRRIRDHDNPGYVAQRTRERACVREKSRHLRDQLIEPTLRGGGKRKQARKRSAVTGSPNARLSDDAFWAGQDTPSHSTEPLVQRDVHRVEQRPNLRVSTVVVRRRFPDSCPVEVRRDIPIPAPTGSALRDPPIPEAGRRSPAAATRSAALRSARGAPRDPRA